MKRVTSSRLSQNDSEFCVQSSDCCSSESDCPAWSSLRRVKVIKLRYFELSSIREYRRRIKGVTKMENMKKFIYISHQAKLDIGLSVSSEDLAVQLWI
jgi:hypothetical protein